MLPLRCQICEREKGLPAIAGPCVRRLGVAASAVESIRLAGNRRDLDNRSLGSVKTESHLVARLHYLGQHQV